MTHAETLEKVCAIFAPTPIELLAETAPEAVSDASCVNCDYRLRAADLVCDRCANYIAALKAIHRAGGKQQVDRARQLMRDAEGEHVPLRGWVHRIADAQSARPSRVIAARPNNRKRR